MANHSINIKLNGSGGVGGSGKPTSSLTQFQKKSDGMGFLKKTTSVIRNVRTFNISAALGNFGKGTPIVAVAQETARAVQGGVNLVATIQSAKTGETMRANNLKKEASAVVNPIGYIKSGIWENGVLRNMELARENQSLEYRRQLTGDLIYSKNTQNTIV